MQPRLNKGHQMKTELKAVEILKKFANNYESAYALNSSIVASLCDIEEALFELQELTQKIDSLEALVDNPNIDMTYREFLKAALNNKIN